MEWCSLELKLLSCKDIKAFNFFQKLSIYVVVSIINDELKKKKEQQQQQILQRQKTPIDRKGGGKPEWNHMMQFDLKALSLSDQRDNLFLKFDLRCEGLMFGKKSIGEVRVPIKDLIDEFNGAIRFISYQIRTSDGKPNGVLNFSYEVTKKSGSDSPEVDSTSGIQVSSEKVHNKVNGKTMKSGSDSPEVDSTSGIQFSSEKVHYPSVEVDDQSRDICYPSLDDVSSPLPETCFLSPKTDYRTPEIYGMTPPLLSQPHMVPVMVAHRAYYHPYPSPLVQMPGPYLYTLESMGHGYSSYGSPGFGQLGMVGGTEDGPQLPGSSTTSSSR